MPSILIISPDPDTRRMFELAFELEDIAVETSIDGEDIKTAGARHAAVIIDMVEDTGKQWQSARRFIEKIGKAGGKGPKIAILLPRTPRGARPPKYLEGRVLFKKPYEFVDIVRRISSLVKTSEQCTVNSAQ